MAYEDFTTYTEVDGGNEITVTSSKVEWVNMARDVDSYVYKDFGVDTFGNVDHDIEVQYNTSDDGAQAAFWLIANMIEDFSYLRENLIPHIIFFTYRSGANYRFYLWDGETGNNDYWIGSVNTLYYCTVDRTGTAGTVKIYSDSDRTNLLVTLAITCTTVTFRYLYAACSFNDNSSVSEASGFSQNFDIPEEPPLTPLELFDSVNISDGILFEHKFNLVDTINLTDSLLITRLLNLTDTINIEDSPLYKHLIYLIDTINIDDSVSTVLQGILSILDNISILDDISINVTDICSTIFQLQGDSYTVFLPMPEYAGESGSLNNELVLFDFWSNERSTDTIGIDSEPIILGGVIFTCTDNKEVEMTSIAAKFLSIQDMMDNHEEIRITGLNDCVDAVYIIKHFRYGTIRRSPFAYTWQLTLEYVRAI